MTKMDLMMGALSKVFGDFVSKVVSDGTDVLKGAIKEADLDRKSYNQNLQTMLYQLMIDALNGFTYNKYEKQDKLYDAAESILEGYMSANDNTDAVKSGLKMLVSDVNNDTCQEFLETLCYEICRDDNSNLYKEIDMFWKRTESEYIHGVFDKINQNDREILENLNDLKDVLAYIIEYFNSQRGNKVRHYEIPIKNRAEEYADKWDKNVFLNNFNKRDKNAGVNIKLKDIYLEKHLPHYIWRKDDEPLDDLKDLLSEYTVDNGDRKMLLILGQPGIGKSTLITWVMANLVEKQSSIYVYQFASDLKNINWQDSNILSEILKTLGLGYGELENKSLILDGFDEINVSSDRERILNKLSEELDGMNILKRFSLIITCRENYVDISDKVKYDYIILQAWEEKQIRSFCEIYEKKSIGENLEYRDKRFSEIKIEKILEKKEIFGIPLILYMVLALNVDIEKNSSIGSIYDQIFSLKGGAIYNRCYDIEHRINEPDIKECIYQISQRIAFWIFENNSEKALIFQKDFKEICDTAMNELEEKKEDMQSDVLIGNYFKLVKHCEGIGTDELQFAHRSIYEYFVAVYFFESIRKMRSKEEVAGKLGELLKKGRLSEQILEFIKYKFDGLKEHNLSDITREVFNMMLRDGMTYYTKKKYRNVIAREMKIFFNMLEVVHLWNSKLEELDEHLGLYLICYYWSELNLSGANLREIMLIRARLYKAHLDKAILREADLSNAYLREADLREASLVRAFLEEADLSNANLSKANLSKAHLDKAILREADLSGADLSGADLMRANLFEANLSGANLSGAFLGGAFLRGANLSEADLSKTDLFDTTFDENQVDLLCKKYDLSDSRVYISESRKTVSYKEYCLER